MSADAIPSLAAEGDTDSGAERDRHRVGKRGFPYQVAGGRTGTPRRPIPAERVDLNDRADPEPGALQVRRIVEPIVASRAFEKAIEHIVDGIERAHLRPGDRMPGETELSEQLSVSKPTLRQALRILERSGVVRVKRGARGGIFVASDLVPSDMVTNYVVVEANAVIDILAARRIVEGAVTELAALAGDEQDFTGIERANVLMQKNMGDHGLVLGADASFHRAVTRSCRNRTLEQAMMRVARDVVSIRDAYIDGAVDGEKILEVHERQLRAMRARNLSELVQIMDEHFRMLEEGFARAIGRDWAQVFGGGHHHFMVRLSPPLTNL